MQAGARSERWRLCRAATEQPANTAAAGACACSAGGAPRGADQDAIVDVPVQLVRGPYKCQCSFSVSAVWSWRGWNTWHACCGCNRQAAELPELIAGKDAGRQLLASASPTVCGLPPSGPAFKAEQLQQVWAAASAALQCGLQLGVNCVAFRHRCICSSMPTWQRQHRHESCLCSLCTQRQQMATTWRLTVAGSAGYRVGMPVSCVQSIAPAGRRQHGGEWSGLIAPDCSVCCSCWHDLWHRHAFTGFADCRVGLRGAAGVCQAYAVGRQW
jgi:hypothetical protein